MDCPAILDACSYSFEHKCLNLHYVYRLKNFFIDAYPVTFLESEIFMSEEWPQIVAIQNRTFVWTHKRQQHLLPPW